MATGRTVQKFVRVYLNAFDMSGYTRNIGPLQWEFDPVDLHTLTDAALGYLPDRATISPGVLNGVMNNTATSGLHVIASAANGSFPGEIVSVAIGIRAAPALGDPVFTGQFPMLSYHAEDDAGASVVNIPFGMADGANLISYAQPWSRLLHPLGAESGSSSATGIDDGAASSLGGFFYYHVTSGDGTATLSVDDSANNSDWTALASATSGEIETSTGTAGIVALGTTATVRRYLRFQISLNGASTVTFVSGFARGIH
jgi:hypothetical protein